MNIILNICKLSVCVANADTPMGKINFINQSNNFVICPENDKDAYFY